MDVVDSVETLEPGSIKEVAGTFGGHQFTLIAEIAHHQESRAMILLLDANQLMQESRRI
ncbi:hypothetical protein DFAR_2040023 [Desulfarculales bacterium]